MVLAQILGEALGKAFDEVEQRAFAIFIAGIELLFVFDFADFVLRHTVRQIAIYAAWPEVGRVHARARDRLVHIKQIFAFAKSVNDHIHGAAIHRVRTYPQQVVHDARDL